MERLSGLDASFLYVESLDQPLHVCSILELDGAGGGDAPGRRKRAAASVSHAPGAMLDSYRRAT